MFKGTAFIACSALIFSSGVFAQDFVAKQDILKKTDLGIELVSYEIGKCVPKFGGVSEADCENKVHTSAARIVHSLVALLDPTVFKGDAANWIRQRDNINVTDGEGKFTIQDNDNSPRVLIEYDKFMNLQHGFVDENGWFAVEDVILGHHRQLKRDALASLLTQGVQRISPARILDPALREWISKGRDLKPDSYGKAAVADGAGKWPDNCLVVKLTSSLNSNLKNQVRSAAREWNSLDLVLKIMERKADGALDALGATCEKTPHSSTKDVKVMGMDICAASLGYNGLRIFPGSGSATPSSDNVMWLNSSCANRGTILHEFFHSAGFLHEHQRVDRNQYLKFSTSTSSTNYRMVSTSHATDYDICSISHYPTSTAFDLTMKGKSLAEKCSDQIVSQHVPSGTRFPGQRVGLSKLDVHAINAFYK